jgi:chorismate mutase
MWLSAQLNVPNLSAEDKKAVLASLRLIRLGT